MGILSEVEGRMDAEQYVAILEEDCCRAWRILEFLQMKSFSSRIMIPSIPPEEPRSGLRSRISSFWIGLLNLQTLTPLNTLGVISKNIFQDMRRLPQGFINYGIEWW